MLCRQAIVPQAFPTYLVTDVTVTWVWVKHRYPKRNPGKGDKD